MDRFSLPNGRGGGEVGISLFSDGQSYLFYVSKKPTHMGFIQILEC